MPRASCDVRLTLTESIKHDQVIQIKKGQSRLYPAGWRGLEGTQVELEGHEVDPSRAGGAWSGPKWSWRGLEWTQVELEREETIVKWIPVWLEAAIE